MVSDQFSVDRENLVAGPDSGLSRRRARGDAVDVHRSDRHVLGQQEDDSKYDQGRYEVHERTRHKHDDALVGWLVGVASSVVRVGALRFQSRLLRRVGDARRVVLAQHPHESAQRYPVYGVDGIAVADSEHTGREAETELQDLDAEAFRGEEVSEFVNENQETEDGDYEQPGRQRQSEHSNPPPVGLRRCSRICPR